MPDIDIDFFERNDALKCIDYRIAARLVGSEPVKHNTGIYVQEIPHNPFNNIATIDYKTAEERGYFKIDFLNVSIYNGVRDETHLSSLLNKEPDWALLEHEEIIDQLFHINGHSHIVKKLKPKSIEQLAAILAIIRPAKKHLINESWDVINQEVWKKSADDGYVFKKSHSIAYASAIVVQLNLIEEQALAASN
jgi:DNA polymerase III alpha subunit